MTISLERPALPADVVDMVEPGDERHTVVTVRLAVSRHHLAAAVEDAFVNEHGGIVPDTDGWAVEDIRRWAAFSLACMSALELEQGALAMERMAGPEADDVSLQWWVHGIYRAVDRAFPNAST
jgi:hypothetical protein